MDRDILHDTIADRDARIAAEGLLAMIDLACHPHRGIRNRAYNQLPEYARRAHRAAVEVERQRQWERGIEGMARALFPSVEPERQTYGQPGFHTGD